MHLDQLKWLMSPDLANAIEAIRDLRTRQEDADATAKALALAGKPEQEVAPYAEEAIRLTKQVEGIYERVDNEMATVYVRLKEARLSVRLSRLRRWKSRLCALHCAPIGIRWRTRRFSRLR